MMMDIEGEEGMENKQSDQKEKGRQGLKTEENGCMLGGNVTDVMRSQASGRGKRSFFHWRTQENRQVGKEAEVSDRNYFSKHFSIPLSPYCKIENNVD